ncbi:hypothetical protein FRC10_008461 [Ceratobasidium sp. 414]|nr:hypothetical protein FRC10_008461 [Ceratobasidium sp. 414]
MPRLWKHVDGVSQLLPLLPTINTLAREETIPPEDLAKLDFSRFEAYSPWVEHFEIRLDRRGPSDAQSDMLYYYAATRVLLPKVRSIISTCDDFSMIAVTVTWFMAFLSPSLVSLDLAAATHVEMTFPPLPVLLHALSTRCPNLQTLAVIPHPERPSLTPAPVSRILKFATSGYKTELEEQIKCGPGPSLGRICGLINFTVSINTLDRPCLDVISAWPLLERLEIIMIPDVSYQLPELAESAFPSLVALALHEVPDFNTFNSFWSSPALVGKLTSVRLLSSAGVFANINDNFLRNHTLLSLLVDRSPQMQQLWLKVRDAGITRSALDVPISVLDPLQRLPLRMLHIEGICLTGCDNVPKRLAATLPALRELGLPHHRVSPADLQMYQSQMPQLRSLCLGVDIDSLSQNLNLKLSDIERYRRSPFHTLQANFFEPSQMIGLREKTSPCAYGEIILLIQYLFSLWPNVQLSEKPNPFGPPDFNTRIPGDIMKLVNSHLAALSCSNWDPTIKYEAVATLSEELWNERWAQRAVYFNLLSG